MIQAYKFIMPENPEHKKSRSVTLLEVDAASINRSQLNSSTSKMQYSIGKASRFQIDKDKYAITNSVAFRINSMISPIQSPNDQLLLATATRWI